MYKYIALAALVLGSAALGFSMNRSGVDQFALGKVVPGTPSSPYIGVAALLDVDQDGLDDIVKARFIDASTIVLSARFNHGDMTLSSWSNIGAYETPFVDGCTPYYMAWDPPLVLDLNGDSYPDLVCPAYLKGEGCESTQTVDFYFINNGSGGFACTGDVTGDGATGVDDLLGVIADWGCAGEGRPD